jgi:hypothetical protein
MSKTGQYDGDLPSWCVSEWPMVQQRRLLWRCMVGIRNLSPHQFVRLKRVADQI